MFRNYITLVTFLFFTVSFAQNEGNIWYFGNHAGLDFSSGSPVALTDGQTMQKEGTASIADASGQLLFYTDGITVWDRTHQIMPNGTGLKGDDTSTQSALIVPKPNSSTIYYIFTSDGLAGPDGVQYSEVDLSLNSGLGDVTALKNVVLLTPASEKLTATKKPNGDGYWVLTHGFNNNNFYAYSVSSSGVNVNAVISSVGDTTNDFFPNTIGTVKFSPDGTKVLNCICNRGVELFDFNLNTGYLTNPITIDFVLNYSAEFSPSGKIVYVSGISNIDPYPSYILQYNIDSHYIENTELILGMDQGYLDEAFGVLQLGPDGKIYMPTNTKSSVCVINNPDVLGLGCDFQIDAISLGTGVGRLGMPQFVQSYFYPKFTIENLCFGSNTQFQVTNPQPGTTVVWDFGDGSPTSNDLNPFHQYSTVGVYTVTAAITYQNNTKTVSRTFSISAVPVIANAINDQYLCGSQGNFVDLGNFNNQLLGNQSTSTFRVDYYPTLNDAQNSTNRLFYVNYLNMGISTVYAKVYNIQNRQCYAITSINFILSQQPIANTITDYIICENIPYDDIEQIDLSFKNSQVLGNQNASDFTISYHATQSDADNDINPLPILYTNTLPEELIYVRIENNVSNYCFDTTILIIRVLQQPQIITVSDYKICDDASNNGIATFDLSTKTAEILNGQSATSFIVKYYLTAINAQNETNAIATPISNTTNNQTIYYNIKTFGLHTCKATGTFKLIVNPSPIANSTTDYFQCDDVSNDGIGLFDFATKTNSILGNQNPSIFSVSYHLDQNDANVNANPLSLNYQNTTNPQTIFVRVGNNQNSTCYSITSFQIGLYKMPIANPLQDIITCDDQSNNGTEIFNLSDQTSILLGSQSVTDFNVSYHSSQTDANNGSNVLPINYSNTTNPQTIYARIENKLSSICYDTSSFQLMIRPKPLIELNDFYSICQGSSITINANQGFTSYLWSNSDTTPNTTFTQAGNYSLTVTQDYGDIICDATKNFVIYNSNIATITNIETQDWTDNENTISVQVTGDGDYEYSLDGNNFQDSNQFFGILSGEYTVFVRDKKGCGTATEETFLLMYPRFFTPNADGINDYWQIKFSSAEPNLKTQIFDRHGRILIEFYGSSVGWDGSVNGLDVALDDYWFVVKRVNGKEYKGHFSLKR